MKTYLQNLKSWLSIFAVLTIFFTSLSPAMAVPAYRKAIKVTQKDGTTITIQLHGDEYFNWKTTANGVTIAEKDGIFFYADYEADGKLLVSNTKVVSTNGSMQKAPAAVKTSSQMEAIASVISAQKRAQRAPMQKASFPTTGKVKTVIILAQYSDVKFKINNPLETFTRMQNEVGFSDSYATGSAYDYFLASSNGKFEGEFDVYGPYTLPNKRSYYGSNDYYGNDLRPDQMTDDAVALADADVDFSQYDLDGDGYIDNVFIYYAGNNEAEGASEDTVWPHKWVVANGGTYDGKTLFDYACTSELRGYYGSNIAGIGTFCHEFSHVLGLADIYDTDGYSNGYSEGMGDYNIMTGGSYNNNGKTPPLHMAFEMEEMGWLTPKRFTKNEEITLEPSYTHDIYRIDTEKEGECFYIENRTKDAIIWDKYIPNEGVIITQIDKSSSMLSRWENNGPNNYSSHECARFVSAANDYAPLSYSEHYNVPFPCHSKDEWNSTSTPKAKSWAGKELSFGLSNIHRDGNNMVFTVTSEGEAVIIPTALIPTEDEITLEVDEEYQVEWSVKPTNATSMECNWKSSNIEVASVSSDGLIMAWEEGTAIITATSVLDENVKMEIKVTVPKAAITWARAAGKVLKEKDNSAIVDLELIFTALPESGKSNTQRPMAVSSIFSGDASISKPMLKAVASPTETVEVRTNGSGSYTSDDFSAGYKYIGIPDVNEQYGQYKIETVETPTLTAYDKENPTSSVNTIPTLNLEENPVYGSVSVSFYNDNKPDEFINSEGSTLYAIKLSKEYLEDYIGYKFLAGDVLLGELGNSYTEMAIVTAEDFRYKTLTYESNTNSKAGYNQYIFQDEVLIRPETDYYLTLSASGQIAADNSSSSNDGALVWNGADQFVNISTVADVDANLVMTAYLERREIVDVSSIEVHANTEEIFVSLPFTLTADVSPAEAVYNEVKWTSSNENAATISKEGEVTFLEHDVEVTFTATSTRTTSVSGSCTLSAKYVQGLKGTLTSSDMNPLSNATINFYPVATDADQVAGLTKTTYSRVVGAGPFTTTTDENGEYQIDLDVAEYEVEARVDGLVELYQIIEVQYGLATADLTMNTYAAEVANFHSWTDTKVAKSISGIERTTTLFSRWNGDDLADNVGDRISKINALVVQPSKVTFYVYNPETKEYLYTSDKIEVTAAYQFTTVNIPDSKQVKIESGVDYLVGYAIEPNDGSSVIAPVSYCNAVEAKEKGDLLLNNKTGELTSLTSMFSEVTGNFIIGFYTESGQGKKLTVEAGQTTAVASWDPKQYKEFKLVCDNKTTGSEATYETASFNFKMRGLDAGSDYEMQLLGSINGKDFEEISTISFKTLPEVVGMPMILISDYNQTAGTLLDLEIINSQDNDELEWYLDLAKVRDRITLTEGKHTIKCIVTRGGKTYEVRRKINVK